MEWFFKIKRNDGQWEDCVSILYSEMFAIDLENYLPETLCVYIGQRDINGKEIYENDMVIDKYGNKSCIVYNELYSAFTREGGQDFGIIDVKYDRLRVIGNKYD